jgi:hypothetical protein
MVVAAVDIHGWEEDEPTEVKRAERRSVDGQQIEERDKKNRAVHDPETISTSIAGQLYQNQGYRN